MAHYRIEMKQMETLLKQQEARFFNRAINLGMAEYLMLVKSKAPNYIRENPQHKGYKELPSLPNRLTSRTGALVAGLKEGEQTRTAWLNVNKTRANTDPMKFKTFHGRIVKKGDVRIGTWTPFVRMGSSALVKRYLALRNLLSSKAPEEQAFRMFTPRGSREGSASKSITFSAMWELKGRPYFAPANDSVQSHFKRIMYNSFSDMIARHGFR